MVIVHVLAIVLCAVATACSQQATSEAPPRQVERSPQEDRAHDTKGSPGGKGVSSAGEPAAPLPEAGKTPAPRDLRPTVVFLGDSLTAGLGLDEDDALPSIIESKLESEGISVRVINAGVSGDTTAGGLSRLDWLLRAKPYAIVVELGANDGLRGLPLGEVERNLREIIVRGRAAGASILLVGMLIPTNYGPDYTRGFAEIYPRLAREMRVPLVPFLLEGVAGHADLNQPDGIHPTARGYERVAENVLPYLRELLRNAPPPAGEAW